MSANGTSNDTNRPRWEPLRLRAALVDRITGLPSLPLLFDDMRSILDKRRHLGLLHLSIANLGMAENVYGWQAFDRIVAAQAREMERMRGGAIPFKSLLAQTGVHAPEIIAVLPARPDGSEIDAVYLQSVARDVEAGMRTFLETDAFRTIVPRLEPRIGFAVLSENPFYRFERLVYRAVDEARARPARRAQRLRRSLGEEIQHVIREETISVHYQPVVDLETLAVIGYEALSRGPAGSGLESAAVMFEVSRESGLAAELDRLCRRLALASAGGIGKGRKLFINTRPDHLADPEWHDARLEQSLALLQLAPGDLVIEIPQPDASSDEKSLEQLVGSLRRRGFRFAIDDIGTGYAGIQAIERLKPDYLKIDISLVHGIESNLIQQDLLGSLVRLGRRIGAAIVAEGIESEAELAFLKSHGARYGQGFLFSAAVPTLLPGPMIVGGSA